MGCFSWLYADGFNNPHKRLVFGGRAYIYCPEDGNEKGTVFYEQNYDCYGNFCGYDIYELVLDWNRNYISEDFLRIPRRESFAEGKEGDGYYKAAVLRYEKKKACLKDYQDGVLGSIMEERYGRFWKRELGIAIACYKEDNARLRHPIRVFSRPLREDEDVSDFPASENDPMQGCR